VVNFLADDPSLISTEPLETPPASSGREVAAVQALAELKRRHNEDAIFGPPALRFQTHDRSLRYTAVSLNQVSKTTQVVDRHLGCRLGFDRDLDII